MLIERFKPPKYVAHVAAVLAQHGGSPHYVGGAVRDAVISREPHDYDIASSLSPDVVQSIFNNVIPTGARHGTVTVMVDGHPVEVTTFRSDGHYVDGRHPDAVAFVSSIEQDLSRRDFTMNAIAIDATTGTVVDPYDGVHDAVNGTIRTVGDPERRFAEDGLRAMRAIRFGSQLGFTIDSMTLAAIKPRLLSGVSRERIRDELMKTLSGMRPCGAMLLLHSTGVLERTIGRPMADASVRVASLLDAAPRELRLPILLCTAGIATVSVKTLTQVLKFESHDARTCSFAAGAYSMLSAARSAYDVRRALSLFGRDPTLAAAHALDDHECTALAASEPIITARSLPFDGNDVMQKLGAGGAAVGAIIRAAVDAAIRDPKALDDRELLLKLTTP